MKTFRTLLTAIGIGLMAVVLPVAALAVSRSAVDAKTNDWVGSWNVVGTVTSMSGAFPVLMTFTSDGSVIGDETPSPLETSSHGAWIKTGGNEGAYTTYFIVGNATDLTKWTLGKVSGTLKYNPGQDKWSGPFKITVADQSGAVFFTDTGTMKATRISVEH
jgi:hypothetical protein